MASIHTYAILDQTGEVLVVPVKGQLYVGLKVTGDMTGTIEFEASRDILTWAAADMTVYGSYAKEAKATEAGSWYWLNTNAYDYFRVRRTESTPGTGTPTATVAVGNDGSYRDVFVTTARTSQGGPNGIAKMIIRPPEGHGVRLTKLLVSFSGGTPTAASVSVTDDASDLWAADFELVAGHHDVPLPDGGIVATPASNLTITVPAAGSGVSGRISAEVRAA